MGPKTETSSQEPKQKDDIHPSQTSPAYEVDPKGKEQPAPGVAGAAAGVAQQKQELSSDPVALFTQFQAFLTSQTSGSSQVAAAQYPQMPTKDPAVVLLDAFKKTHNLGDGYLGREIPVPSSLFDALRALRKKLLLPEKRDASSDLLQVLAEIQSVLG